MRQEGLHPLVEGEVEEEGARPRKHHHEDAERALRRADAHVAERAPVDLRLLAGLDLDAQVGLSLSRPAQLGDVPAEHGDAVLEAALAKLAEEAHGGELG